MPALELLCPFCLARNRIPGDRDPRKGRCGRCRNPLVPPEPPELDADRLERFVEKSPQPVMVDVFAHWCGPCRAMAPAFARAAAEIEPRVRFVKLDVDRAPELAARLSIRGVPTLILFKGGREIARQSGALPAGAILALARRALAEGVA